MRLLNAIIRLVSCEQGAMLYTNYIPTAALSHQLGMYDVFKKSLAAGFLSVENEAFDNNDKSEAVLQIFRYLDREVLDKGATEPNQDSAVAYCYSNLSESFFELDNSFTSMYFEKYPSILPSLADADVEKFLGLDEAYCAAAKEEWGRCGKRY